MDAFTLAANGPPSRTRGGSDDPSEEPNVGALTGELIRTGPEVSVDEPCRTDVFNGEATRTGCKGQSIRQVSQLCRKLLL
jgi:hypothetical protein